MRGSTQLKVQIRAWAEGMGRWREFVDFREGLKKNGVSPASAWVKAAQMMDAELWGDPYDGEVVMDPVKLTERDAAASTRRQVEVRGVVESGEYVEEVDVGEVVIPVARRTRGSGESAAREVFGEKRVATVKVVEWVASNMQVSDVIASQAPSSEAWGMLVWARRSPVNESQFWSGVYAKLLPSRAQIEGEMRYADDGKGVEDLAKRLLALRTNETIGAVPA